MLLIFPGEFISLNKYGDVERTNRYKAAEVKEAETRRAYYDSLFQIQGFKDEWNYPLIFSYTWYCLNRSTDPSNIAFAIKYIEDGMQHAGIISGDGWKQVTEIHHFFKIDKINPRVEVEIKEHE